MIVRESQNIFCPTKSADQCLLRWWQNLPVAEYLQRRQAAHGAVFAVRASPACHRPSQEGAHRALKDLVLVRRGQVALDTRQSRVDNSADEDRSFPLVGDLALGPEPAALVVALLHGLDALLQLGVVVLCRCDLRAQVPCCRHHLAWKLALRVLLDSLMCLAGTCALEEHDRLLLVLVLLEANLVEAFVQRVVYLVGLVGQQPGVCLLPVQDDLAYVVRVLGQPDVDWIPK